MPSKTVATTATFAALPDQIEIFRAGRHTDDAGVVRNFSEADVAAMAAAYDPALREAPLTIGHPEHNLPAYGWVKGLVVNAAGRLAMNTHQVLPQFAEMVAAKMFKKRSTSFYPPDHPSNPKPGVWYPRHVAFLGAQPPAIAGLADFAEGDSAGTVNFSEGADAVELPAAAPVPQPKPTEPIPNQEQLRMSKELEEKLAAAQAQTTALQAQLAEHAAASAASAAKLAEFAENAKRDRTAAFTSFAEEQVKAGRLLPKDAPVAVTVLNTLADSQPVSFAEAGATKTMPAADWLKNLITAAKPVVNFGEHAAGTVLHTNGVAGRTDAEIDADAQAYAKQHKVNYAEALSAVTSFTS